jgi:hypothetical protein
MTGLSLYAAAQPTITKMEDHSIGTVVRQVQCDTAGVTGPGSAGANQSWNFASLAAIDTMTDRIVPPTSTSFGSNFPDASYARITNDGSYTYIQKTATDNYLVGAVDSLTNTITKYYDKTVFAQKPLTYLKSVTDSYTSLNTSTGTDTSKGTIQAVADAWGTLVLPNGTFSNTIRVKLQIHQVDSIQAGPNKVPGILDATTYLWYDNQHFSALMRWDSTRYEVLSFQTNVKTITYLLNETYPVSVSHVAAKQQVYSVSLQAGKLVIYGQLAKGAAYNVSLFDLNGKKLHAANVTAADRLEIPVYTDLPQGMYLVTVQGADGQLDAIRVIQQ